MLSGAINQPILLYEIEELPSNLQAEKCLDIMALS